MRENEKFQNNGIDRERERERESGVPYQERARELARERERVHRTESPPFGFTCSHRVAPNTGAGDDARGFGPKPLERKKVHRKRKVENGSPEQGVKT